MVAVSDAERFRFYKEHSGEGSATAMELLVDDASTHNQPESFSLFVEEV
jgi:hypothetical protein